MKKLLLILAFTLIVPATAEAGDVTMVARDVPLGQRALQSAAAPIHFNMLGVHWRGAGQVRYRTRSLAGTWSSWRIADADTGPDLGSRERRLRGWHEGDLVWTGAAAGVQFRAAPGVQRVRAYYVWSRPKKLQVRSLSLAGSPAIVTREQWEADEKITRAKPLYAPALRLAIVHHTAGRNTYTPAQAAAIVRAIEVYHVKGNGWNDIGYNFLVDRFGTVYEGRAGGIDRNVVGAHSLGFNSGTVGVALIGNDSRVGPTGAQQEALVRLLAWRLDVAHVDPASTVAYTSGGNSKFRAGKVVTLKAISGHRDTGPSDCPGAKAYALLPSITRRVAAAGLPKLYSASATGLIGGDVRFQARLSSRLPWTVTVTTRKGKVVGTGAGRSAAVDWTWSSRGHGKGPFAWTIDAGTTVLAATGTIGGAIPRTVAPAVTPSPSPTPAPKPAPAPSLPQPAPLPQPGLLTGLTVTPGTLTPAADGSGGVAAVGFALTAPALVTATVTAVNSTAALMTLLSAGVSPGQSTFQWSLATLRDGRYRLSVAAETAGGTTVTQTAEFVVDRTLGGFTAFPSVFSPNGDGVADTVGLSFSLTQPAPAQVVIQRNGAVVATVWTGQVAPGQQVVSWDGTANGARLPDGEYVAVVTSNGPLGAVSFLQPIVIDTSAPTLTLLDRSSLRFEVSEAASVSVVVDGQAVVVNAPRGVFTVPWGGGAVTTFTAQARDAAGNAGTILSG